MFRITALMYQFPLLSAFIFVVVSFIGLIIISTSTRFQFTRNSPKPASSAYPLLGSLGFFGQRWNFFRRCRDESATGNFSFFIGKHPVVGITGTEARKTFFEERGLGFKDGYEVLFGNSPNHTKDLSERETDKDYGSYFTRRISRMLKPENLGKSLPKLRKDIKAGVDKLAADPVGVTDPFESIYRLVFQLTMRMVGSDDLAEDSELLETTLNLYTTIDQSTTATAIMFPRFPSPAVIKRTIAGGRLYAIFSRIVNERKRTGRKGDDPLQFLIDEGDSMSRIIEFVVGALFAGLLNSGINAAWVLVYLANDQHWLTEARKEVELAAAKYSTNKSSTLIEQLDALPLAAWESQFPFLELCLRDSIRLQLSGCALRRNVSGHDIPIAGSNEIISPGAYVAYPIADVHLDPAVYPNPLQWDPMRYMPDRAEDKKAPHAFVGWGTGLHPCLGMRFAKLEQNMIVAYFLATFDFEVTNKEGVRLKELPRPDDNAATATKPKVRPFLKYTRREM